MYSRIDGHLWQVPAATNALASGTEMTSDAQGSRVILTADGSEPDKLSDLVHQVAYLNTREFPSPGKRILQLQTTLHCKYVALAAISPRAPAPICWA